MIYESGDEIVLDNDIVYTVSDSFELNGKYYLFLISNKDRNKVSLMELKDNTILEIKDDNEYTNAFNELINRNKDIITKYMEEASK